MREASGQRADNDCVRGSVGVCSIGWLCSACGCYLGVCPPCRCGRPAAHTLLQLLWVGECLGGWYEHGGGDDTRGTTGHQTPAWAAWPYRPKGRRVEARWEPSRPGCGLGARRHTGGGTHARAQAKHQHRPSPTPPAKESF